jgi:hypothetical protein
MTRTVTNDKSTRDSLAADRNAKRALLCYKEGEGFYYSEEEEEEESVRDDEDWDMLSPCFY